MQTGPKHHEAKSASPATAAVYLADDIENGAPRLAVEYRPAEALIPYARNSRVPIQMLRVAQIAASIRGFGWTNPILVDGENGIHCRPPAALGGAQARNEHRAGDRTCWAFRGTETGLHHRDNKMAPNAAWDNELLSVELGELDAFGFDLSLTGFGENEVAALTNAGTPRLTDPDDIP